MITVELGGGKSPKYHPNIDVIEHPNVDIVQDLEKHPHLPFKDVSVDLVYASHILEHLCWTTKTLQKILSEISRILKKGAVVIIKAPDFDLLVEKYKESGLDNWDVQALILGGWFKGPYEPHKTLLNVPFMMKLLQRVGITTIHVERKPEHHRLEFEIVGMKI